MIHHLDSPESNLIKLINETNAIMLDNNLYFFDLLNALIMNTVSTLTANLSFSLGANNSLNNSLLMASSGNLAAHGENPKVVDITHNDQSFKLASFLHNFRFRTI